MAESENADAAVQGVVVGRYTIKKEVGRGATATVYAAHDERLGRMVALKVIRPELAETGALARFQREARRTAMLHHPRILPVLDVGEWEGRVFFALPYLDGGTLRHRLTREKQLAIEEAVRIARTVAEALDYAHAQGLVHRDIKPENILFSEGEAFLADFGIARAFEFAREGNEVSTSTGIVKGTPAYMSPEQASGSRDYDGRSDIFSLGCVLYEMLAGMHAYVGPTPQAVISQRFLHTPRDVRVYRPLVSDELEAILEKALAMLPADRFPTAGDLARALEAPGVYQPPTGRRRLAAVLLGTRRRRIGVAAAVGLAAITAITAWLMAPGAGADRTRTAVLYFDARQPDSTLRRFADAITEDLIHELSGVSALRVVPKEFVAPFRGAGAVDSVARRLNAGTIVEGTVSRAADTLRVLVHVVDARTRAYTDSVTIAAPASELTSRDAAQTIATAIRQRMGREVRLANALAGTRSDTAQALMRRALRERDDADLLAQNAHPDDRRLALAAYDRADSLLEATAGLDTRWVTPSIERAWVANAKLDLLGGAEREAAARHGLSMAEEAMRLDPRDARALEARGAAHWAFLTELGDSSHIQAAATDLRGAVERDSTLPQAWALLSWVHWQRDSPAAAALAAQRALNVDAYLLWRASVYSNLFFTSVVAGEVAQAREWCRRGRLSAPGDRRFVECELIAMQHDTEGLPDTARAWGLVRQLDRLDPPEQARSAGRAYLPIHRRILAATVSARAGDLARARAELARARRAIGADSALLLDLAPDEAYLRLLLGERGNAVDLLNTVVEARPYLKGLLSRAALFRGVMSSAVPPP